MPKAKRSRVRDSTPFHNASGEGMEISDDHDIVFQPSELGNTSRKTSKSSSKRKLIMMPEDSSPVDGMNQEESEKALLDALLPTLPKKGLSVRQFSLSWSFLLSLQTGANPSIGIV